MKKIYLLGLPILTLILAGCFHVKPVADAVKYNCEYSGGKIENGKCACPKGENDKDVWIYEESSGYCLTPFGTPGGERGEEMKKMSEQKFQESDTSQNTYKNAEFGFSFQYPKNWVVSTDPYLKKSSLFLWVDPRPAPEPDIDVPVPSIRIAVHDSLEQLDRDHKGALSLRDYLEKYRNVRYGYDGILYSGEIKEVQIGNRDGYWVRTGGLAFAPDEYFFVSLGNGVIIEIDRYNKGEDNQKTEAIVKAILASFEFTK